MTFVTKTAKPNTATDQDFRDFVTAVRTGFTDLGWVRTSDTGQIDPTTVLKPAAINTAQGYDMFRMADTLQATAPFFVKVEYGSGPNAAYHGLWVTVGTATTGAGAIGGQVGTRAQIAVGAADTTVRNCTFAGGSNRIAMMMFDNATAAAVPLVFVCERSHADDGSDTGERVDVVSFSQGAVASSFQQIPSAGQGPVSPTIGNFPALIPPFGSGMKGPDVGVYPLFAVFNGPLRNPMIGLLIYVSTDISDLSDVPVSMYGTQWTYRAHGVVVSNLWNAFNRATTAPLILVS